MSNVLVNKDKIDILANAISVKSGEPLTLTLDEMVEAVDGIEARGGEPNLQAKTYTVDSAGTETITADGGYDGLSEVEVSVPSADVSAVIEDDYYTDGGNRKWTVDYGVVVSDAGWLGGMAVSDNHTWNAVPSNTTITPSTSAQTIGGANYMMEGAVTVSAVPLASFYTTAESGFYTQNNTRKWRVRGVTDLDVEEGDVEGWHGHGRQNGDYAVFDAVPSNTTITPTESSQTVGGTNYMMEGAVTVNAIPSNYVGSGITQRSSSDLTASGATVTVPSGYYSAQASKAVASGTAGTPTATKGAVSNHSVSVTPSVTNTTGYITGSTKTGTAVTVSASELVSGSETKTTNGTYDVTNLASLVVNVSGGTSKNVQVLQSTSRVNSTTLAKALGDLTVSKTGTYDIYWSGGRTNTSSGYTWGTRLYIDGTGYGTENTSWTNNCQSNHLSNVSLTVNQKLSVYSRGRSGSSYYSFVPMLVIVEV